MTAVDSSASQVARAIEAEILDRRLAPGHFLGTESELIARHGVSRPVLGAAVRLLEQVGIAGMRRGQHGGLVVTAPESGPLAHTLAIQLRFRGTSQDDMYAARELVEVRAAVDAARRCRHGELDALRTNSADGERKLATGDLEGARRNLIDFHRLVGEASGNDVFAVVVGALGELTDSFAAQQRYTPESVAAAQRAHRRIADAIAIGDTAAAGAAMRAHVQAAAAAAGCAGVAAEPVAAR